MMEWHTIDRVVVQHLTVYLDSGSGKAPTCYASALVYIERDKWGIDPNLIVKGTIYNLTHLSWVLWTPNLGVVDEKCAFGLRYFNLLGQASNDGLHSLYFG